ncbi:hypothetical protein QA649_27935 [Bradyrhizobium sp. CB1717]|uniref:hypothetical protein n=1 Tax=Bradyrhizobium sp. CB1717 TaxID=3039154 RepID=UPI0024B19A95|nr:hypothetical protein [Bradyrhizobium sp. CB1717]WFU21919.1 hypothetical protein QA649_27935 [Bradyrhizobium sp. CB1717]
MKKPDMDFVTRTTMALATELDDRSVLLPEERAKVQAILAELGVRTPYPPVADDA